MRNFGRWVALACAWGLTTPLQAEPPLAVTAVQIAPQAASQMMTVTGSVEAHEMVPVAFKGAGRIIALVPELGDRVSAGDVIARLEPTQAAEVQRAAAAQVAAAEAAATQAEQAYTRARDLLERGAGRQAELDSAEQTWLEAVARRDEARANLVKAQQALDDMTLVAPISGVITERNAEEGQIAAPGQPVVSIAAEGAREAVFAIPSVPMSVDLTGRVVDVALLDDLSQSVTGSVTEVSPLTDAATGTITLRVALPDGAETFGLGAAVVAGFEIAQSEVIAVPARALTRKFDDPAVWVIDPQSARVSLRPVTVARYTTDMIELSDGVTAGEWVAVAGSHLLYPDRPVTMEEVRP